MSVSICLIALALGYLVFIKATKEEGGIRLLGQVIGIVVMIFALLAGVCSATKCAKSSSCGKSTCAKATTIGKQCPITKSS